MNYRSENGEPITCGKPILVAAIPSLCHIHLQKYQRSISQALRKAGINVPSGKPVPKFSAIIAEYVRQIQGKRREALAAARNAMKSFQKDEI